MLLIILNILMTIHYCISHFLKVTVELRQQPWNKDLGAQHKPKISLYFDVSLALTVLLCLFIGNAASGRYGGAWETAVVIGYFVVLFQALAAWPVMDSKKLVIVASLEDAYVWLHSLCQLLLQVLLLQVHDF